MGAETVLVTDAGLASALAIVRSLARAGYRVIAADTRWRSPGMVSRDTAARWRVPAPECEPEAFVASLERAVEAHGVDLILPVTDKSILPLSAARERFEPACRLAMASPEALAAAADKDRTAADARALGIPVPETWVVETLSDALAAGDALGWPVVVKPRSSKVYRDGRVHELSVTYAGNVRQLHERVEPLLDCCPVMLQRWCPGRGVGVELLLDAGEPLLAFQHERLREFPVHGGPGALRRAVPLDPELYRHAVELLAGWRWTGLAMVEFKLGERGAWLMEVNGRVWGSLPLAVQAGVDFPAHYVRMLLGGGRPAPDVGSYRAGVRVRNLGNDLLWIVAVAAGLAQRRQPELPAPGRGAALHAALQLLDPRIGNDVQSLRDPLPGLVDVFDIARKLWRKRRRDARGGP